MSVVSDCCLHFAFFQTNLFNRDISLSHLIVTYTNFFRPHPATGFRFVFVDIFQILMYFAVNYDKCWSCVTNCYT